MHRVIVEWLVALLGGIIVAGVTFYSVYPQFLDQDAGMALNLAAFMGVGAAIVTLFIIDIFGPIIEAWRSRNQQGS